MNDTIQYLKNREWSMGNGQCPECCGCPESWLGHPCHLDSKSLGHKKDCILAKMMEEHGLSPLYIGDSKLTDEHEGYITEIGTYSTRLKTKDGCPILNEHYKKLAEDIEKSIIDIFLTPEANHDKSK